MERIPQPIMDKRGEPHMKRFEEQRWLLDNIVRTNGVDWDQPRSIYISSPCGPEGGADIAGVRERVKKIGDIAPAFEAVASLAVDRPARLLARQPRVSVVVDDLASIDPWSPRGIKVIGTAVIEDGGGSVRFRITPEVIISWAINDTTPGIPKMERRAVR